MKKCVAILLAAIFMLGLVACGSSENSSSDSSDASESTVSESGEEGNAPTEEEEEEDSNEDAANDANSMLDESAEMAVDESASSDVEEANETEGAVPENEVSLPLSEEVVTISYWVPMPPADSNGLSPADVSFNAYMLEETNIDIDFVGPPANAANDNFSIMIASNDYPDFIEKFGTYYTAGFESAVEQEVALDVADLIDQYMPNYKAAMVASDARVRDVTTDSGYIPGFASFYQDVSEDDEVDANYGLVIRGDWLEELGLNLPNTYDDYYTILTAFRDNYSATMWLPPSGVMSNNVFVSGFQTGGLSSGSTTPFFVKDDGVVFYGPTEDGFYEYIEMLSQWYAEGLIWEDFPTAVDEQNPDSSLYTTGTIGLFSCSYRSYSSLVENYPEMQFEPALNPVQSDGDEIYIGQEAGANGINVVLTTGCENPELCAKLVDWMYTDEAVLHSNYGFEGEAYTLDENGNPVFTELITNNPDHDPTEALAAYSINYFVKYTDPSIERSLQGDAYINSADIWGTNDGNQWNYPSSATMTDDEASDFNSVYTEIETYMKETILKWITGQNSLTQDAFEEYKTNIDNMGISTCLDVKQAAYDRYSLR